MCLQGMEYTLSEQRKSCPSIAHALDQFELVDLPLDKTIVVGKGESCNDCCFVTYLLIAGGTYLGTSSLRKNQRSL